MIFVIYGLIVCCTTYIGFGLADYYIKREKLFKDLSLFCERLNSDIGFLLMPLTEILKNAGEGYSLVMTEIINVCQSVLEQKKPIKSELLFTLINSKYINDDEKKLICSFFSMLGKSDEKTQIDSIENYHKRFLSFENISVTDRKKFSPMFKKLGFLSGLAICLFML